MERETLRVRDGRSLVALVETRTTDTAGDDDAPPQVVRYQRGDHLASSRVEVDELGRILSYEEYAAFGATVYQGVRSVTDAPKRFRFTGHERDEATGLYAMGARFYAPWLGRWISCDPAGLTDSPKRYEYVANNPVRHAFKPDAHPVSAAVLNNMAKRGEGTVQGATGMLKQTGKDYGDIAYSATHLSEPGTKNKLTAAIGRRLQAPEEMAVGMVKGFASQLKSVSEGLGTVAYYRPELLGLAGLPSPAKEQGADAKVAIAITDTVLDGPQIELTVDGGINLAKGGVNLARGARPGGAAGGVPPKGPPSGGGGAAGGAGGSNLFAGLTDAEIDASVNNLASKEYYRTPVEVSEQVGRVNLDDLVPVSRWGKPGLRPGDWVMPGDPTSWNYRLLFKWDPNPSNEVAGPQTGQSFTVPGGSIKWPSGVEAFKGLFRQRRYGP